MEPNYEQQNYQPQQNFDPQMQKKALHVPSLVLSIIGAVFALLLPLVTYPCSIVGLVMAVKNRETWSTTVALVLCIIGLVLALINSILGAMIAVSALSYL